MSSPPSTPTTDLPPVVELRGLTKVFRDFWLRPRVRAIDGLDLAVQPREVLGLLGPNGSGKTTTIKIILGLLYPTRGRVAVLGRHPTDVAVKRRLGYLPEESYLYPFLSAEETLDYHGRLFQLDRRTRHQRVDLLLEMVGLEGARRRLVGEFSKGMQRRVGLAQALIGDPDLLLLDEPTSGLDPLGTRQVKSLITELRSRGKTVLLSSHLLADVEDVCDRVAILYGGRVQAQGSVDELLASQEATLIETAPVTPEEEPHLRKTLEDAGIVVRALRAPRQRLEEFFLGVVGRARGERTDGARAGGPVASFLGPGSTPGGEEEDLIGELLAEPAPAAEEARPEDPIRLEPVQPRRREEPGATTDTPDQDLIDRLLAGEEPA